MKSILDSDRVTLAPSGSLAGLNEENFRRLDKNDALQHLEMLQNMLNNVSTIAGLNAIPFFRGHDELKHFCATLIGFLQGIIAKKELEMMQGQDDIGFDCVIDPSHSGYPLFLRDLHFLSSEQKRAEENLENLPPDDELVEDALFSLFRGLMPKDVILMKLKRNFYTLLKNSQSIGAINFSATRTKEKDKEFTHLSMSLEYLDENTNIPKLYLFEVRVTHRAIASGLWLRLMLEAIQNNLGGVAKIELNRIAKIIEAIDGVQVDGIQRLDVGPFRNQHTQNEGEFAGIIQDQEDCLFMFRLFTIQRMGQQKKTGIGSWFRGIASGDWHHGTFSKVIQSPIYIVMHHRLVQRAHIRGLKFQEPVKMFGISSKGVILD